MKKWNNFDFIFIYLGCYFFFRIIAFGSIVICFKYCLVQPDKTFGAPFFYIKDDRLVSFIFKIKC